MKTATLLIVAVATLGGPSPASDAVAGSLLYLTAAEWELADRAARTALANDLMRIYCGDVRMSVDRLIDCLDEGSSAATKFEQALGCLSRIARESAALVP